MDFSCHQHEEGIFHRRFRPGSTSAISRPSPYLATGDHEHIDSKESAILKKSIIKPPRLRAGDLIGIISPSGPVHEGQLHEGISLLESFGFGVRLGAHVYDRLGYLAGNDAARLSDLHDMFRDPETKAIFCTRGGYGSPRLLDKIQYGLIADHPKIFVGYSDITALLLAIHSKTGLLTFHGPMLQELNRKNQDVWHDLFGLVSEGRSLNVRLMASTTLSEGNAVGPLLGGNLSIISHLVGTPFLPSFDGCVLFLEDRGEPPYRVDRMLTHLLQSFQLEGLAGLLTGHFEACGDPADIEELLKDRLLTLNTPLATGLPVGHGPENTALPIGLTVRMDTRSRTLFSKEGCVR